MKNFLQFMIPLAIIMGAFFLMMHFSNSKDSDYKLYIKCNGKQTQSFALYSGIQLEYKHKTDECKLDLEVENVSSEYLKFNTSEYLLEETVTGAINEDDPRKVHIVVAGTDYHLYSMDTKTKFTFQYK